MRSPTRSVLDILVRVLSLLRATVLVLQESLAVLVQLDLGNHDLGRVDGNRDSLAVGLVTRHALDVDAPLLAVDLDYLPLAIVVVSAHDEHLVVLADRQRAHGVLGAQILGQRGTHEFPADVGGCLEVCLAALPTGAVDGRVKLHDGRQEWRWRASGEILPVPKRPRTSRTLPLE